MHGGAQFMLTDIEIAQQAELLPIKEVAAQLGITEDGVKRHIAAIFPKLGVESRSEAVVIAMRKHLLKT